MRRTLTGGPREADADGPHICRSRPAGVHRRCALLLHGSRTRGGARRVELRPRVRRRDCRGPGGAEGHDRPRDRPARLPPHTRSALPGAYPGGAERPAAGAVPAHRGELGRAEPAEPHRRHSRARVPVPAPACPPDHRPRPVQGRPAHAHVDDGLRKGHDGQPSGRLCEAARRRAPGEGRGPPSRRRPSRPGPAPGHNRPARIGPARGDVRLATNCAPCCGPCATCATPRIAWPAAT